MKIFRLAVVLSAAVTALAVSPDAKARDRVGNYEPYYVGRVFYAPLAAWRPVYSFPVATRYGVVYQPYVYQNGWVVCRDYIPAPQAGYGGFIVEGHDHYYGHDSHYRHDRGHHHGRAHSRGHHGKKKHKH